MPSKLTLLKLRVILTYQRSRHLLRNSWRGVYWTVGTLAVCSVMVGIARGVRVHTVNQSLAQQESQASNELASHSVMQPTVSEKEKHGFAQQFARLDKMLPSDLQVTPSLLIAQGALESSWGQSTLYQRANNPFGVKGSYHGKYLKFYTDEYVNGKKKTEMSAFKQYPNLTEAIKDHNQLLKQQFLSYSSDDYVSEAQDLQNNGYATDPNYAHKLMYYVQQNHLTKFD